MVCARSLSRADSGCCTEAKGEGGGPVARLPLFLFLCLFIQQQQHPCPRHPSRAFFSFTTFFFWSSLHRLGHWRVSPCGRSTAHSSRGRTSTPPPRATTHAALPSPAWSEHPHGCQPIHFQCSAAVRAAGGVDRFSRISGLVHHPPLAAISELQGRRVAVGRAAWPRDANFGPAQGRQLQQRQRVGAGGFCAFKPAAGKRCPRFVRGGPSADLAIDSALAFFPLASLPCSFLTFLSLLKLMPTSTTSTAPCLSFAHLIPETMLLKLRARAQLHATISCLLLSHAPYCRSRWEHAGYNAARPWQEALSSNQRGDKELVVASAAAFAPPPFCCVATLFLLHSLQQPR